MTATEKPWTLDDAARARIAEALAAIDARHALASKCRACGQPVTNPLPGGFCRKNTPEHNRLKAEAGWRG